MRLIAFGQQYDEHLMAVQQHIVDVPVDAISLENLFEEGFSLGESEGGLLLEWGIDGTTRSLHSTEDDVVCWYRKPNVSSLHESFRNSVQNSYLEEELRALVHAVWAGFPRVVWVNDQRSTQLANLRPLQMVAAKKEGLAVPDWTLSNRSLPVPVAEQLVIKRLATRKLNLPPELRIYTADFDPALISTYEFRHGPSLIQRRLSVKREVRAIVIGTKLFGFSLQRTGSGPDYRAEESSPSWETHLLPESISLKCLRLVEGLGLRYAALDFAFDGSDYWFMELNPNGEYLWLERDTGVALSQAMAKYLTGIDD